MDAESNCLLSPIFYYSMELCNGNKVGILNKVSKKLLIEVTGGIIYLILAEPKEMSHHKISFV